MKFLLLYLCLLFAAYTASAQEEYLPKVFPNTTGVKEIIGYHYGYDCEAAGTDTEEIHYVFDDSGNHVLSFSSQRGINEHRMTYVGKRLIHSGAFGGYLYDEVETDTGKIFNSRWDTGFLNAETAYTYNTQGLLLSVTRFLNGQWSSELQLSYNKNGKLVRTFDVASNVFPLPEPGTEPQTLDTNVENYKYFGDSTVVYRYLNRSYTGRISRVLKDKGKTVRETMLDHREKVKGYRLVKFTDQGLLSEETFKEYTPGKAEGNTGLTHVYKYNDKGQYIGLYCKDATGNMKLLVKLEYRY